MHAENVTTPFGRRPMTLALLKGQLKVSEPGQDDSVDKWKVFRDICESRELLDISDRALAVLNALISFYPGPQLGSGKSLVVFPSNEQLTLRAHGITGTTLRRHLAALIDSGLVIRKDSPNGKRYAHRNRAGGVEEAFGFSLAPLLARASELSALAEKVLADRSALRLAKERLSVCRRDVRKLIATGIEECLPGDWQAFQSRLDCILSGLSRKPDMTEIEIVDRKCRALRAEIFNLLETKINSEIPAASDVQTERHLQNPNTDTIIEKAAEHDEISHPVSNDTTTAQSRPISLTSVLKACPQIHDYARDGQISTWEQLHAASNVVRLMLGVSTPAYEAACRSMGSHTAAATMACILERGSLINSAGGYLRDLTRRAEEGGFSLMPMLMALLRIKSAENENMALQ